MSTFTNYVEAKNKNLKELSNEEIYYLLLEFVKKQLLQNLKMIVNVKFTTSQLSS